MNRKKVFLNEKVAKKLIKNEKYGKILSAKVISGILNEDYEDIYNSIKISSEEIAFSSLTVNSTVDSIYYNDVMYFNIEFNFHWHDSKEVQLISYVYQISLGQLRTSKNYQNLKKVLQISIDAKDIVGQNEFIYHIKLMDEKSHKVFSDKIEFVHINLDYLSKISYNEVNKNNDKLMKTLYFLICDNENEIKDLYGDDELMKEIVKEAKEIAGIEKMHLYVTDEELLKQDQDFYYAKGKKEGKEVGKEEGMKQMQKEIILKMYKQKYSLNDIAEITNLSTNKIKSIIDNG